MGTAHLAGLPATVQAGMFAAAPGSSQITAQSVSGSSEHGGVALAAARFDHLSLSGQRPGGGWAGDPVGGASPGTAFHQAGGTLTVTGSGDIAPDVPAGDGTGTPIERTLLGAFGGLIAVIVVAAMFITAEYRRGLIRVTFTALPRRTTVLAAKAGTIAALVLAAGAIAVLGAWVAGRFILPSRGFTPAHGYPPLSLGDGPVLRAAAGSVLYLALIALLSLGAAVVVRDAALAIGAVLGLLYAFPIVTVVLGSSDAARHIQQIAPMTAGLAIQATTSLRSLPIGPWAGLGVLAAWAAAALLAGGLLLHLRDA